MKWKLEKNELGWDIWRGYVQDDMWFTVYSTGEIYTSINTVNIGTPRETESRTVDEAKAECRYMLCRWLSRAIEEYNSPEEPARPLAIPAPPMADLGWQNGWTKIPAIVEACRVGRKAGEKHDFISISARNCQHTVTCNTCNYSYKIDSGD